MKARRIHDRRTHERFDVTGRWWASLGAEGHATVCDIAADGALLEATLPRPLTSLRTASVTLPAGGPELTVAIRHVRPVDPVGDDRYRIGVEFLNLSERDRIALDAFVDACRTSLR